MSLVLLWIKDTKVLNFICNIFRMRLITVFFFSLLSITLSAQTIKIWGDKPVSSKMKHSEMTVFKAKKNPSGISVIICPGGSYRYMGIKHEGYEVAEWLNEQGITAFVLRYRTGLRGNHHPAMIQDVQRAIQLVRENGQEYGIDTAKVGLIGFSAGGHLVGSAATYFDINFMISLGIMPKVSLRPAFVAMIYPVVSMTDSIAHKKSRKNLLSKNYTPELVRMMSLEQNVRPDMPPVFLIQCKGDKTVDYRNAECYNAALNQKNIPHYYKLYEEEGHGFGIDPKRGHGNAPSWNLDFIPWLKKIEIIK